MSSEALEIEGSKEPTLRVHELGSEDVISHPREYEFHSTSALEIMRETVRILRINSTAFMSIAALFICPVSAVALSDVLVDHSMVKRLTTRLLVIAKTAGLPLNTIVNQSFQRFSEMAVSAAMCFPLYMTLLLLSKTAVVYSVDCSYSNKQFDAPKFWGILKKLWKRVLSTYFWACMVLAGLVTLFIALIVGICSVFLMCGFSPDLIIYPGAIGGLAFSLVFANAIIICNVAIVISVLEEVSGPEALMRSSTLIKGQVQVGLLLYLVSSMGMAFVQGLYDHRVKKVSYGDGSSRLWEGPLLVLMYSFVMLIDSMMTVVFYFSCRWLRMESALDDEEEKELILEMGTVSSPHHHSSGAE